jgi:hypothetical protein
MLARNFLEGREERIFCCTPTGTPGSILGILGLAGDWSHYTDTSKAVVGHGASNMVTVHLDLEF